MFPFLQFCLLNHLIRVCAAGFSCWCWWWYLSCGFPSSRPVRVASSSSTSSPSAPTCSPPSPSSSSWAASGREPTRKYASRPSERVSTILCKCCRHGDLFVLQGAFWGLVIGLAIGCVRMLLDFIYPTPPCYEEDTRPGVLKYVHYLYFSILLSVITLSVVVVVSLATEEPTPEQVKVHSMLVHWLYLKTICSKSTVQHH